ncbi:MAG TPA: glycosyltransferase, partial [Candidatus Acidoferrales bacterium]|nr:glycosyltransferase [Candidatus Acidoferrales bacterium]
MNNSDRLMTNPNVPERPCPVCQSAAPVVLIKQDHAYQQCPACDCVFTPLIQASALVTANNGHVGRHEQNQDRVRLERLTKALGREARQIIDFGCGQGETTRFLQSQGLQATGIDQDTAIQLKDMADGSVDGIMMVEVIEHLYAPQAIFSQFNRVLKSGGVVYVESSFADKKELATWNYLDPAIGHCTVHTLRSMELLAEKNGFAISWVNPNVCCLAKKISVAPATENPPAQPPLPRMLALQRVKSAAGPLEPAFLAELTALFGLRAFVETGTFLGNTTAIAGGIFEEVHTIELSTELAAKARARFANTTHIHVHQGDSAGLLSQILEQLSVPALFWLDGHYSEGVTAKGQGNTPILDEIAAIVRSGRKDAVIMVDDLRLFERRKLAVADSSSLHGYPTVAELHAAVQEIDPGYQFFVYGDIALAFPATANVSVSPLVLAMTISRLFNGNNLPVEEVIGAESLLAQAEGIEREVLCELPAISAAIEQYGLGLHYRLWQGHVLLGQNDFAGAKKQFLEIQRLGFKHWRGHWYLAQASVGAGEHSLARMLLDALVEAVPNFTAARELRQKLPTTAPVTVAALPRPMLTPGQNAMQHLCTIGVYRPGQPLRLHLGCGEQHFDGYVNIDYPPSEHSCQTQIGADVFADITKLLFPPQSVDEIRLHHVFEHFKRSEALALLIRWHEALKVGGRLHLETPDLDGCARQLVSNIPFQVKQVVIRHCFGSQEAGWANHYDGWTAERYCHVLGQLGFSVQTKNWSWPHPPHLANVEAFATKTRSLSRAGLLAAADRILSEYMTVDVPSERGMCEVWRKAMRDFLAATEPAPAPVAFRPIEKAAPAGDVVVKLQGGLGNQMFQFAAGLALARRNGSRLKLDLSFLRDRTPRVNFTQRDYCLDLFRLPADCEIVADGSAYAKRLPCHVEQQFHFDPKFLALGPNAYLDGYFQSARFFEPVHAEVLRTFQSFVTPLNAEQQALAEKIKACPAVCLNVRRGDYVANPVANDFHGVCDESYFHAAVAEIQKQVPGAHFFIFSDDVEWCRTANLTNGAPFTLVPHEFAGDRFAAYLQLMAACRHFILPNSSFGWWAAFLGTAPDKMVFIPVPWFDNPFNNTVDMLPAGWRRLPKNRAAAPQVSVVISCHNYVQHLPEAVASVWNQTYRSFEIILVDDGSTDDSPAVAQRLAKETPADISFRIIRLEDVGPTAARRSAIGQARGKYIVPLDADDRIAPEFLAQTVPVLEADAKLGFAYVDTVFFCEKQQRHQQPEYDFAKLCQGNFISHCSLIRKAAFDDVSGYDSENWGYYEDWDLWIRLGTKGWFGKHVGEPLFFYRHHFNSSLSLFAGRLDPIYKAFLQTRHPGLFPKNVIAAAQATLAEMPPGWNLQPPMRNIDQLKSLLIRHPGNRHVLYFLGCALMKGGASTEAETVFKNLLAMHPNDTQAQEALKQLTSTAVNGLVSVIVPTYNRPDWLGETLQSILAQTYRNFEIIVVNDAGPDVSHVIEPLNADGQIRLIRHEKNKGLAGARNTGVRAARGQYIAYLDDDDIYHPHHLATLVSHLQATGAAVVYSDAHRGTQRKQGDRYVVVERSVPYSHDWDGDKILVHNFIPVLCFLHRRECAGAAGWFDESLTTHEDWDLWMRMSRLFEFSHIKQVTCEFRWRDDGSSMSSERQADFARTAKIIYAKNPEFVANRPDLQARRQQYILEHTRPATPAPVKPAASTLPVSIVIPVFNKVEFTQKCLARLAANPCAVEHEIIVVDDHSSDETEAFCRGQLKVMPNLRYHRLPENRGFGRACNHGAEQARGHWVVFLNNDTEPEAGWLEAAVARLQSDPAIGILGAKLLYPDRTVQHCGIEFSWADNPDHKIWPLHRHPGVTEHDPKANVAGQVIAVTGACLFIERSLFQSIGQFSPEYAMYFEDADLCFKSWRAGRTVFYEPACVAIHHESQSSPNRARVDALNRKSGEVFFKKWAGPLAQIAFDSCLEKSDGRFNYFRPEVLQYPGSHVDARALEATGKQLIRLFTKTGPFYMHFGGAGDALLLLATFLDKHPDAQVVSFPNSIPAARSFFEAFPSLKRVWFLPQNKAPQFHILLRMMMRHSPDCLGMGTTPEGDYFKDWHAGLDIFGQFNVSRRPEWTQRFKTNPQPKQIVLAPKGSLCGMVGTKRNIIAPEVWPQLVKLICKHGFQPVIIGTPDEAAQYPCLKGCEDRRSFSFQEQMEHIANSAMLIGADSWAKTFSALAGVSTLVFEPIKGTDWNGRKDPSDFVFLDPWETITVVKSFEQCRSLFERFAKGTLPAKSAKATTAQPLAVSWEGSFLDHGSLSHVNRELVGQLKPILSGTLRCVSNGAPAA